jgi:DTW domain-containing protein YfiP
MSSAIQAYLDARLKLEQNAPKVREYCRQCVRPEKSCYCHQIKPLDAKVQFVILIHPIEQRRRIATGRMAHLCLKDSLLIPGYDYTDNAQVNALIDDPENFPVILFPGMEAANLSVLDSKARAQFFPKDKKLVIFVIDGTWSTARTTMRVSHNLKNLTRVCFSPTKPSHFRVRQQPAPECYSTIEAIHHTIELMGDHFGFDLASREHDSLLKTFDWMVETQLAAYQREPLLRKVRAERHNRI